MNVESLTLVNSDLAAYLTRLGVDCTSNQDEVIRKLELLLGEPRFGRLLDLLYGDHEQSDTQELYGLFATASESNLFISLQSKVMLETSTAIYQRLLPHLAAGSRIADLGCFTGGLIGWMAARHPECQFVGFDCNPKAIQFAAELSSAENLVFGCWDYARELPPDVPPFNLLYSIFGLEFHAVRDQDRRYSLDLAQVLDCPMYRGTLAIAHPCFLSWRRVAHADCRLFVVLRINCIEQLQAVIDAAEASGWQVSLAESSKVASDDESFALLTFVAGDTDPADLKSVLDWWCRQQEEGRSARFLDGDHALQACRLLPDPKPITVRDFHYPDGHTMRLELGLAGEQYYLLHRSTAGFTQLQMLPPNVAEQVKLDELDAIELPFSAGE